MENNINVETAETEDSTSTENENNGMDIGSLDRIEQALKEATEKYNSGTEENKVTNEEYGIDNAEIPDVEEEVKPIGYTEIQKNAPPEIRAWAKHLLADYTKKTQALAEKTKQYEAQQKALVNDDFMKQLKDTATKEVEFDPFNEQTYKDQIKKEAAAMIAEMFAPVQKEVEKQKQQMAYEKFQNEHPDLKEIEVDVAKELMDNEHLSLEGAYWQVKGKRLSAERKNREEELENYRNTARDAGLKVGGGTVTNTGGVPNSVIAQGAYAIYKYLETKAGK